MTPLALERRSPVDTTRHAGADPAPSRQSDETRAGSLVTERMGAARVTVPEEDEGSRYMGTAPGAAKATGNHIVNSGGEETDIRVSALSTAAASLFELATADELRREQFVEVARRLRQAANLDRPRGPRQAVLADVIANALAFTSLEALRDEGEARDALVAGYDQLLRPFIVTDAEGEVAARLLKAGWKLTPPYRGVVFATTQA